MSSAKLTYRDVLVHRRRTQPEALTWDGARPLAAPLLLLEMRGFTPISAPRSNARTRYGSGADAKRLKRYYEYRDEVASRFLTGLNGGKAMFWDLFGHMGLVFRFPTPESWSMKKRVAATQFGAYHRQKPDIDNLVKGFLDALLEDDHEVCDLRAVKLWVPQGQEGIDVYRMPVWV